MEHVASEICEAATDFNPELQRHQATEAVEYPDLGLKEEGTKPCSIVGAGLLLLQ
jgi:hypothetical protein